VTDSSDFPHEESASGRQNPSRARPPDVKTALGKRTVIVQWQMRSALAMLTGLLPEKRMSVTQWSVREMNQPLERPVQFQDQEDCARNRERTDEQRS
jgi:hypothetical protein